MTTSQEKRRPKRPLSVSLLAIVVLTFTSLHLLRFVQTLRLWNFLLELPNISPLYLALTGFLWGFVGLIVLWGLWCGHPTAPQATRLAALGYSIFYWLDRLWLAKAIEEHKILPFTVGLNLLLLAFVFWVFSRPRAKIFFGERHEQ